MVDITFAITRERSQVARQSEIVFDCRSAKTTMNEETFCCIWSALRNGVVWLLKNLGEHPSKVCKNKRHSQDCRTHLYFMNLEWEEQGGSGK